MMVEKRRTSAGSGPSISVIIPVHNGERTIERCLLSVLDQTMVDFEVVVVDNASTDSTKDVILSLSRKNPRIKYAYEGRKGRGHARAKGIESSTGEILTWTDADCEVPRDWLERLLAPMIEGKEKIVQGNEDTIRSGFWSARAQKAGQRHMDSQVREPPYIDHLDTKNFGIRKDLLVEIGGFDRRLKALEDFELKIRLKKAGNKFFYIRDLRVKHHHRETFRELFRSRFEQGFWAAVIFYLHRDFFDSENGRDNTIKSMYILDMLMFPLHLGVFLFRNGPREWIFEAFTGYIWRMGNLKGRFCWRRYLEETSDG
ncbi:MAG: glycosyltransferase [Thermoplasmatota archaeon]